MVLLITASVPVLQGALKDSLLLEWTRGCQDVVIATPESTLSPVGNARIVGCSLYHVRPHHSWTPRFRITAHLCAFNQSREEKKKSLSSSMVTVGVPLLWQKWLLRASGNHLHWPQESRIRQHRTQRSLLSRKSCLLCVLLAVLPQRNPELTSRQSRSSPVCGSGRGGWTFPWKMPLL